MTSLDDFRAEVRAWLTERLEGEYAGVVGTGGPGREHEHVEERQAWEQELGRGGWIGLGWPREAGGRGAGIDEQGVFYEEYARAGGPGRIKHPREQPARPTLPGLRPPGPEGPLPPGIPGRP